MYRINKELINALAYEADFIYESDMFDSEDFNTPKQYEFLNTSEIAKKIHSEPNKRVVFALFFELDEKSSVMEDTLDGWFSISLRDNYKNRGKYLLLVGKVGARTGVDVGERYVGAMPTLEQVTETVKWVFDEFNFGQDLFCVCVQREDCCGNDYSVRQ